MSRPGYVDRQMLKTWADQLVSKGEFPRLVRQLILETTSGVVALGMPAGDGVAAGGWDGSVRSVNGNAWVPHGYSVWELSVNSSPGVKADDDYCKRVSTPDGTATNNTTYVEAILRPWTGRDEWARDKAKDKVWSAVRALGLDDIEAWLQNAPVTWAWLSEQFQLNPHGVQAGLSWWTTWSSQTSPALTTDLVLSGRATQAELLDARSGGGVVSISGQSINDVCAFVAAAAVAKDLVGEGQFLARLAFVDDRTTWRRLLELPSPLVLVAMNPEFASEVPGDTIHTVLVPLASSPVRVDIELPDLEAQGVADALRAAKPDLESTDALGRLARRSLTALRRRLARKPELVQPVWAQTRMDRMIRAMLLLGSWSDKSEGDRKVAENLSGTDYETFKGACLELSRGDDPFLTHVGEQWHLVSPVDAWMLLAGKLTEEDLQRLKTAVETVIGEVDPALDLPVDTRWWRASIEGKLRQHSGILSNGLSETLALLGVYGDDARVQALTGTEWATYLVRELFDAVQADVSGHGWQSIASMLPRLAEAAPEVTAKAIATALADEESVLRSMFTDEGSDFFSATSPHTALLWALEVLAWNDDLFGQAIDSLARLDQLDPGGRTSNRPSKSLSDIFCSWHPENNLSVARRLKVLDALRRRYPSTAEPLLHSMLPESHGTHFPTASPRYRDWKPAKISVTHAEYHDIVIEVLHRLIADAKSRRDAWISLLDSYANLPPDGRTFLRSQLGDLVSGATFDDEAKPKLWRCIGDLTGKHRSFSDAKWALPEAELEELDALADGFAPTSPIDQHANLFDDWNPYIGEVSRRDDFEAYDQALTDRRIEAARQMAADGNLKAIHALALRIQIPGALGHALAAIGDQFDEEVFALLEQQDNVTLMFVTAYYQRRFYDSGWAWAQTFLANRDGATTLQQGMFLSSLRDFPKSWEVAAEDLMVAAVYWQKFGITGLGQDFAHVQYVGRELIEVGRFADALHFIGIYGRREAITGPELAEFTAECLEKLLTAQDQIQSRGLRDHDFTEAFECLERQVEHLGIKRVADLEWAYLGALGFEPRVPALSAALATDPNFFSEMISLIYRSSEESELEPELSDEERALESRAAGNAYNLLRAWDRPPGLEDNTMNLEVLRH